MPAASEWNRLLICPLVAAACLRPFPPEESIAFTLASNSLLSKKSEVSIVFKPRCYIWNGVESSFDRSEYDFKSAASFQVLDKYGRIENGRPLRLERGFTSIEGTWEARAHERIITGFDGLEGCAIVFE